MTKQTTEHESEVRQAQECMRVLRNCGYSVNQIADDLGISRNSVTLIANGRSRPRKATMERLQELAVKAAADARAVVTQFIKRNGGRK